MTANLDKGMEHYNWTRFCKRVNINAPAQTIYDEWTTPAGLESWFLRKAEFTKPDRTLRERNSHIQKGDTYKWLWFGHSDEIVQYGEILEAKPKELLKFSFTADCLVTVTLKSEEGTIVVELVQEKIPEDPNPETNLYIACGEGWTFYLANLKSILEGGIDLRNKNDKLQKVINA